MKTPFTFINNNKPLHRFSFRDRNRLSLYAFLWKYQNNLFKELLKEEDYELCMVDQTKLLEKSFFSNYQNFFSGLPRYFPKCNDEEENLRECILQATYDLSEDYIEHDYFPDEICLVLKDNYGELKLSEDGKQILLENKKGKLQPQKITRFISGVFGKDLEQEWLTRFSYHWDRLVVDPRKPLDYKVATYNIQDVYTMTLGESSDFYTTDDKKSLYNSCMRYDFNNGDTWYDRYHDHHCTEAYNSGEFECHYLTSNKRLHARCMVWVNPENNQRFPAPVYAVNEVAAEQLRKKVVDVCGISPSILNSWEGAKLKFIRDNAYSIYAPYLDVTGIEGYEVCGDDEILRVTSDSSVVGASTGGHMNLQSIYDKCERCNKRRYHREGVRTSSKPRTGRYIRQQWCENCIEGHAKLHESDYWEVGFLIEDQKRLEEKENLRVEKERTAESEENYHWNMPLHERQYLNELWSLYTTRPTGINPRGVVWNTDEGE